MTKQIFFILLFLLISLFSITTIAAIKYSVDETITENKITITILNITSEKEYYVYEINPAEHRIITASLKGSQGFVPRLELWDPITEKTIIRKDDVPAGAEVKIKYTSGYYKGKPRNYYLIVDAYKDEGQTFTLEYSAEKQDDAGRGNDAPDNFREGIIIKPGIYEGYLKDEDNIDYYRIKVEKGETIIISLTPKENDSLTLKLMDEEPTTRIESKSEKGKTIIRKYKTPKEQTLYLGVFGKSPYSLKIEIPGREPIIKGEKNETKEIKPQINNEEERPTQLIIKEQKQDCEEEIKKLKEDKNTIYWQYTIVFIILIIIIIKQQLTIRKLKKL